MIGVRIYGIEKVIWRKGWSEGRVRRESESVRVEEVGEVKMKRCERVREIRV